MKQAKVLTERELKKVMQYIDVVSRYKERDKAMLMLTHLCLLRVGEVANLKVSDVVDAEGNINDVIFLTAEQTKGNDSRRVFVSNKAKAVIKRYIASNTSVLQRPYLFFTQKSQRFNVSALTQHLNRIYKQANIVGATTHSGRRSGITALSESGVSVRVIAQLANHKHLQTTMRYIDCTDDMMSKAIELL
jgi:integrase/recombinase XerD